MNETKKPNMVMILLLDKNKNTGQVCQRLFPCLYFLWW